MTKGVQLSARGSANIQNVRYVLIVCDSSENSPELHVDCDEISVRLMVIWRSDRAWYEPTVVMWYTLVLLTSRRVLLGARKRVLSQGVL